MIRNRSVPSTTVMPELAYADVAEAVEWLRRVFGLRERIRIGNHRAQLHCGDGAVIVIELREGARAEMAPYPTHAVMVRVDDARAHHERARTHGAKIVRPLSDYPYGERQYTAEDVGGHWWTFTQSIADVHPAVWGGTAVELD